ncbi:YdiK family protein [Oceanobacillus bengalensis]|uniref:DUF4305 domain-containing protein n=1 Tax=Oceanobacillus bengalensis TaxID=1435466 RepID=A0A494YTE4_9BACI|nr:YdiK family protein [Oceanobacillus bengalensis]RKQ13401.1 DUF4305 domain-containing protein [Oceanobacillus bengalensis]
MKRKISLLPNAFFYLLLGMMFIFIAIQTVEGTVWNFTTILIALIATFDIGIAIRLIMIHFRMKKRKG